MISSGTELYIGLCAKANLFIVLINSVIMNDSTLKMLKENFIRRVGNRFHVTIPSSLRGTYNTSDVQKDHIPHKMQIGDEWIPYFEIGERTDKERKTGGRCPVLTEKTIAMTIPLYVRSYGICLKDKILFWVNEDKNLCYCKAPGEPKTLYSLLCKVHS